MKRNRPKLKWIPKAKPPPTLPKEIIMEILINYDLTELPNIVATNRTFYNIYQSEHFWRSRAVRDFDITESEFNNISERNARHKYLKIKTYIGDITEKSMKLYIAAAMLGLSSIINRAGKLGSVQYKEGMFFCNQYLRHEQFIYTPFNENDQIAVSNFVLYMAHIYKQPGIIQLVLSNFAHEILPTIKIACGFVIDLDISNYDEFLYIVKLLLYYNNPMIYDVVRQRRYQDYWLLFKTQYDNEIYVEDIRMLRLLWQHGLPLRHNDLENAARVINFEQWYQLYQQFDNRYMFLLNDSIINAIVYGNHKLLAQILDNINEDIIIDLSYLDYFIDKNTEIYGKDYFIRNNIVYGLQTFFGANMHRDVQGLIELLQMPVEREYIHAYILIFGIKGGYVEYNSQADVYIQEMTNTTSYNRYRSTVKRIFSTLLRDTIASDLLQYL